MSPATSTAERLRHGGRRGAPDVVIVDEMTWSAYALARISEIRRAAPAAKIVALTPSPGPTGSTTPSAPAPTPRSPRPCSRHAGLLVREIWAGTIHHAFEGSARAASLDDEPRQAHPARARDPPARRRRRLERRHRPPALGHRADDQVPPLERLPEARRREPHGSEPLRPRPRARRDRAAARHPSPTGAPPDHSRTRKATLGNAHANHNAAPPARRERRARFVRRARLGRGVLPGSSARATRLERRRAKPDRSSRAPSRGPRWATSEALRFLYVRYADNVYGYVASLLRDEHEAEDVTQHVFAKLMTVLPKYEPRAVPVLRLDHARGAQRGDGPHAPAAGDPVRGGAAGARRRTTTTTRCAAGAHRGARRRCPRTSARCSCSATSSA